MVRIEGKQLCEEASHNREKPHEEKLLYDAAHDKADNSDYR